MPRLPRVSGAEAVRTLEQLGFAVVRQRGSHIVMRRGAMGCVSLFPGRGRRWLSVSSTGFQPVGRMGILPVPSVRFDRQDACRPHSQDGCATPGSKAAGW
jgi:predicted RNA binding protein YcfA (HicA-like mRNA interferase family)